MILRSPVCIGEGNNFCRVEEELDKRFDLGVVAAGKLDAEDCCSFEVSNGVFDRVDVVRGAFIVELGDGVGDGSKVWVSLAAKPNQGTNIFLQNFGKMLLFIDGHVDVRNRIDWVATAVGCGFRYGSRIVKLCLFNQLESIIFLVHVEGNVIIFIFVTIKVNSKKMFNITLEVHIKAFTKFFSECFLNFTACAEYKGSHRRRGQERVEVLL